MPYMLKRTLFVFLACLAWFAVLQPWGGFSDPDAFYHAKMAVLLMQRSPLQSFSWLDLTSFDRLFSNQHFLFHVVLIPFVKLFGLYWGTQIAGVLFAALFATFFYRILVWLSIRNPVIWTVLSVTSIPLLVRLSLAK